VEDEIMHAMLGRCVIPCLALLIAGCGKVPILNKIVDSDTLPERVSSAKIIITGKLVDVNERALIDEETILKGRQYVTHYTYYDVGKIEVIETLKGTYDKDILFIKFLSFDQTQPPQLKIDCNHFSYYDIWNIGIWLVDIDKNHEPRFRVNRGNYLPFDRLEEVKSIIDDKNP
jgi:hypothetical protein